MKWIMLSCSIIGLFAIVNPALSQDETQKETSIQIADSTIQYITPLEYAFMMHEETSWLLKASGNLYVDYSNGFKYKLGVEKRIAPSFTLILTFGQSFHETPEKFLTSNGFISSLESRWYYRLNKRIKQNKVARSMSENYIAPGIDYKHIFITYDTDIPFIDSDHDYLNLFVKWGLQRRFLKHGFADIGIKLGATNSLHDNFSPSLLLSTYVDIGLTLTKDKYKLDYEKLCPVMKCYETTNHIFKSNLSNLFRISIANSIASFSIAPHIAFERKLGNSPFSINTEIKTSFSFSSQRRSTFVSFPDSAYFNPPDSITRITTTEYDDFWFWNVELLLEGRYYYNLKHRILKGKTGNGLSADYVALGGSYIFSTYNYSRLDYNRPQIFIVNGWQRVFSKHMYYDIQLGIEYKFKTKNYSQSNGEFDPRFRIAVGYRF